MKKDTILDSIGVLGGVLTIISFIENSFFQSYKILFLSAGVISVGIYIKLYVEEKAISRISSLEKKLNTLKDDTKEEMNKQNQKISKIQGWVEAINFFKNKKGVLDPITLIIVIILIIIIILAIQGKL